MSSTGGQNKRAKGTKRGGGGAFNSRNKPKAFGQGVKEKTADTSPLRHGDCQKVVPRVTGRGLATTGPRVAK